MQEGIPNGREIMDARLLTERKNELEKQLKEGKTYDVCFTLGLTGKFNRFEEENGEVFVVFVQEGVTDRGKTPERRLKVSQILSIERVN